MIILSHDLFTPFEFSTYLKVHIDILFLTPMNTVNQTRKAINSYLAKIARAASDFLLNYYRLGRLSE